MMTLAYLIDRAKANSLTYNVITPTSSKAELPPFNSTAVNPTVLFLLNFTTAQRSALLSATSTLALLYTPENEHFGIGPVEAMVCGVPVLACNSGGPTESVVDEDGTRTGWLRNPDPEVWASALLDIVNLSPEERAALGERAKKRAQDLFSMRAMAEHIEEALTQAVWMGPVSLASTALIIALLFVVVSRIIL